MSGHTPGPWLTSSNGVYALDETGRVNRFSAQIDGGYVWFNKHSKHDRIYTSEKELAANKALIASAPDLKADNDRLRAVNAELLEALEALVAEFRAGYSGAVPPDDEPEYRAAIAAIAKAKGDGHA